MDFYRSYAAEAASQGKSVLEIACGTGRVAIPLAEDGVRVVGLDFSPPMLDVAREKSREMTNMEWVEADMRSFDLGEAFGLIIIPGHAFQNLVEAEDQVACLRSIERHLDKDGSLVVHLDHQNMEWLGGLVSEKGGVFEDAERFAHPLTGQQIHTSRAWSYEPSTQTAIVQTVWEAMDEKGKTTDRWDSGPIRLHCVFRFEMDHLLALTGFEVEALYGNFLREPLTDTSGDMIWVAKKSHS
jgi:ubiquinone/menaquinone biosynthesis C-methylase UbiE